MKHPESELQIACVKWARYQYPRLLIYSVPNGGKRGPVEAAILKAEGTLAGVADIAVDEARGGYFGLKIELKVAGGTLYTAQKAYAARAQAAGYRWVVAYSFAEFQAALTYYMRLPPTRAA